MSSHKRIRAANGYVYVLTHPAYPGHVKIGYTTQPIERRIAQLSTGSPVPFRLAYAAKLPNPQGVERVLHAKYAAFRVSYSGRQSGGAEWFKVTEDTVRSDIESQSQHIRKRTAREKMTKEYEKWIDDHSVILDYILH